MGNGQPDRYAVFGHPIGHSRSPRIHALFAAQTAQSIDYFAHDVPAEAFDAELRAFVAAGGRGLNCTIPLKELAFASVAELSERARQAKAVNTILVRRDGSLFGDNTDGAGLVKDLTDNLGVCLRERRALMLGAGGAVRGVIAPLLSAGVAAMTIANRTVEKAAALAAEFGDLGAVEGCGFSELAGRRFDLVINGTAASLTGDVPPLPAALLGDAAVCYDMVYSDLPTAFVRWARASGAATAADGIGMLIEQAAEAFRIWRGVEPDTRAVIAQFERERCERLTAQNA